MTTFSARLDYLAAATGGRILSGRPDLRVEGLFTDTRTPLKGALFVALRGDNFNGNTFARDAVEKCGAAAVLVDLPEAARGLPENTGAILVADTRNAYLGIAAAQRRKLATAIWFGITGSVGKSTTKEMLAHILEHGAGWKVHKAQGSFNNAVGLSHTIVSAAPEHNAVVLEIGTNHPGEIWHLAAVAQPNVAVITGAAESHLEAFVTLDNVAKEKGDILAFQGRTDTAVLNADDPHFLLWQSAARGRVLSFGQSEQAQVRGTNVRLDEGARASFRVNFGEQAAECALAVPGAHQVGNALAALAAARTAGVSLELAAGALHTFAGVARRLTPRAGRGLTILDDAYNANPASFKAALATLRALPATRRLIVAGDMLELGPDAARYHQELGAALAAAQPAVLATVGELARLAGTAAVEHGLPRAAWLPCATPEDAAASVKPHLRPGDVVLVKGSHGVHLEKCCDALLAE